MQEFTGMSGRVWKYDRKQRIGDDSGMGQVFIGLDEGGSKVAIKRIPLEANSDSRVHRTAREINIGKDLMKLDSENLVPLLDWYQHKDEALIVMPLAARSLSQVIELGAMDEMSAIQILIQVAKGLMDLATIPIIHRDLKPANILQFGNQWRLADFGISRNLNSDTSSQTYAPFMTYQYAAPEVFVSFEHSVKSDLYSLGILAFEMLTGRKPFPGPTREDFRRQHLTEVPPEMINVSPGMKLLIGRLLAKSPSSRPQDARFVLEELQRLATPLAAELASLQQVLSDQQHRKAMAEASEAADQLARMAQENLLKEGRENLLHILQTAVEKTSRLVPDLVLASSDSTFQIRWEGGRIVFVLWKDLVRLQPDPKETLLLAGTIRLNPVAMYPHSNIVYEFKEGRYLWNQLSFMASAGVSSNYRIGPVDRPHGFDEGIFFEERTHMLHRAIHTWNMQTSELTFSGVINLIEDVIRQSYQ